MTESSFPVLAASFTSMAFAIIWIVALYTAPDQPPPMLRAIIHWWWKWFGAGNCSAFCFTVVFMFLLFILPFLSVAHIVYTLIQLSHNAL